MRYSLHNRIHAKTLWRFSNAVLLFKLSLVESIPSWYSPSTYITAYISLWQQSFKNNLTNLKILRLLLAGIFNSMRNSSICSTRSQLHDTGGQTLLWWKQSRALVIRCCSLLLPSFINSSQRSLMRHIQKGEFWGVIS